jgi:outer membrane protein assembly factor BamB
MTLIGRGRAKTGILLLLPAALAALAGCASVTTAVSLPSVSGGDVKALWQADPVTLQAFDGTTLLGAQETKVTAVSAATGQARWATELPKSLTYVEALLPAGNTVVVEGLRDASAGPVRVFALSGYMGLDAASGKILWTETVSGTHAIPLAAVSSGYLVTGATSGSLFPPTSSGPVTGQVAATGKVAWTLPQPKGCGNLGLAADGPLLALSVPLPAHQD